MLRMDMRTREEYLRALPERYLRASKKGRGEILDEYCRNTGMARKSVRRKLAGLFRGDSWPRKKREPTYGRAVRVAVERLWEIFDRACGQRLKPLIEAELGRLRALGELKVDEKTAAQLKRVLSVTIDRLLRRKKAEWVTRRCYGRAGGNLIARKIPLKMTDWNIGQIGFLEMDLVLHCGASTAGEYIHSLSALENGSGWWEGEAVMGRAQGRIFEALKNIRARTSFIWRGIDSDNDNASIEEKNFTHVRRPLGYLRYDTCQELDLINDLYRNELRLYKNFFQPVMRLERKERVEGRVHRYYAKPQTPYQILRESGQLGQDEAKKLDELYQSLNPTELKRRIDEKLDRLYALYEKKRKVSFWVNPYKKFELASVTFLVMQ